MMILLYMVQYFSLNPFLSILCDVLLCKELIGGYNYAELQYISSKHEPAEVEEEHVFYRSTQCNAFQMDCWRLSGNRGT